MCEDHTLQAKSHDTYAHVKAAHRLRHNHIFYLCAAVKAAAEMKRELMNEFNTHTCTR